MNAKEQGRQLVLYPLEQAILPLLGNWGALPHAAFYSFAVFLFLPAGPRDAWIPGGHWRSRR